MALIASYLALVAASAKGLSAQLSIAVMIAVYALLTSSPADPAHALLSLAEWSDVRVFVYIVFSLFTAGVMREAGILRTMVKSLESINCRVAGIAVPALVGLLPMPGGALVSAMAIKDLYDSAKLEPHWKVYLNYWFRHVWVPSWPLFQSVLITAAVLSTTPLSVVSATWPATPIAIAAGLVVAYPVLTRLRCKPPARAMLKEFSWSIWPFIAIALLAILTPLGLLGALIVTALLTVLVYKPGRDQLTRALRFALSPRIHIVLFEALYFKELLLLTGAPSALVEAASMLPPLLTVYMVPFIMGLGAGGENFFAATAIPLLRDYLVTPNGLNTPLLLVAYTGGYLGVMASPVHLCFALTVDYFRSNPAKAMAPVLAAIALTTLAVYLIAGTGVWG